MRRNYRHKYSNMLDNYDLVGLEIPQIPQIAKLVVTPMKVIFVNQCADTDANIDRMFRSVEDFTDFCERYWIELP